MTTLLDEEFELAQPALRRHCYRMLGSVHDVDDALQDTFVRALRGIGAFEGRSSLRSWLYSIATNVCLDLLEGRARRALPMDLADVGEPVELGSPLPSATWVTPFAESGDPAEQVVARETISLAFVAALQRLLPRQRAVLILRDVLRWRAAEVAEALGMTVTGVHSTLVRARAALQVPADETLPSSEVVARYVLAFERYDLDTLVTLLTDEAILSMPPYALWLRGSAAIHAWLAQLAATCSGSSVVSTELNAQPAVLLYKSGQPSAIHVLEFVDGRISGIHAFLDADLFTLLGLPPAPPRA